MKVMKCYECGERLKFTCDSCGTANWMWGKTSLTYDGVSVYALGVLTFLTGLAVGVVWS